MHSARTTIIGSSILTLLLAACAPQGGTPPETTSMEGPDHVLLAPSALTWADAPGVLPKGAKIAVLEGDPSKPGPFTLRLQLPANYKVAPHYHPAIEHVTVISGTFKLGMGDTFDETVMEELPAGSFAVMQTGTRHFAMTRNGGTIQLHGIGPWGLTYVNPADDPREQQQ